MNHTPNLRFKLALMNWHTHAGDLQHRWEWREPSPRQSNSPWFSGEQPNRNQVSKFCSETWHAVQPCANQWTAPSPRKPNCFPSTAKPSGPCRQGCQALWYNCGSTTGLHKVPFHLLQGSRRFITHQLRFHNRLADTIKKSHGKQKNRRCLSEVCTHFVSHALKSPNNSVKKKSNTQKTKNKQLKIVVDKENFSHKRNQ